MSETTVVGHTPGPWSADVHVPRGSADAEWRIHGGRELVAIVNDDEYTEANARLIAAAPEMLEALQHFVWWTDTYAEHPWFLALNEAERAEFQAGYDKASATIAKATGQ